ncbi:MAG: hypothetical protein D6730_00015 [Bacteroidetes bacterium]|nr:MAG: hypothetical protein D6730_00015 [Bacteroidota bacterium]
MMKTKQHHKHDVNVRQETEIVLQAVRDLPHAYGAHYLRKLLQGRSDLGIKEGHETLQSFGQLAEWHFDRVDCLIRLLIAEGYLKIADARFGTIDLDMKGVEFLQNPHELWVSSKKLRTNAYDIRLTMELRQIRAQLSAEEQKPPYRIFSNYAMQQMVQTKPRDVVELKQIPGIGDYKADRYGHLILQSIEAIRQQKKKDRAVRTFKKAHNATHQAVKSMFESGMSVEEMAKKRGVKESTIRQYLFNLHQAGQIDLMPWIETQVEGTALEKSKNYFESAQNPRLKEAYEMLGLDYDTLRLCRLYVANLNSVQTELRYDYAS